MWRIVPAAHRHVTCLLPPALFPFPLPRMHFFHGCTALVTGASSGLGAEFARQLAPHASALILVARRLDRLEALKAELDRPGLVIHCHAADLADEVQTEALLASLAASGERVSLLVNNAGLG